jgi:hypothetical protein
MVFCWLVVPTGQEASGIPFVVQRAVSIGAGGLLVILRSVGHWVGHFCALFLPG